MGSSADEREVRAARNQSLFRAVNERIVEINDRFGGNDVDTIAISCECGDAGCAELLRIDVEAYAAVRNSPGSFAVLADHVDPDLEHVLGRKNGYAVVAAR